MSRVKHRMPAVGAGNRVGQGGGRPGTPANRQAWYPRNLDFGRFHPGGAAPRGLPPVLRRAAFGHRGSQGRLQLWYPREHERQV